MRAPLPSRKSIAAQAPTPTSKHDEPPMPSPEPTSATEELSEMPADEERPTAVPGAAGGDGKVDDGGSGGVADSQGSAARGSGGSASFERLSKPPQLVAGEKQPDIPASLLSSLRGAKGIIYIKFRIRADGGVDSIEIVQSTIPLLDEVIRRHVMGWRFAPTVVNGRAVAVEFSQPFAFAF